MRAALVADADELAPADALAAVRAQPDMAGRALVESVSPAASYVFGEVGAVRVAVVDYGAKTSIMRRLTRAGAAVSVFPHDADPDELAGFDGVLLSNGPGDPEPLETEVEAIRSLLGRTSVLGICLGHQLLGLATGHATFKLPFGHRGANHPVRDVESGRVLVTVQNHGFAVIADGDISHVSLNDGTCEGLAGDGFASVQFHPEAAPGPLDALPFFDRLAEACRKEPTFARS
jgi:carbamoyl-phosphate synthase small subunit